MQLGSACFYHITSWPDNIKFPLLFGLILICYKMCNYWTSMWFKMNKMNEIFMLDFWYKRKIRATGQINHSSHRDIRQNKHGVSVCSYSVRTSCLRDFSWIIFSLFQCQREVRRHDGQNDQTNNGVSDGDEQYIQYNKCGKFWHIKKELFI